MAQAKCAAIGKVLLKCATQTGNRVVWSIIPTAPGLFHCSPVDYVKGSIALRYLYNHVPIYLRLIKHV